MKWWKLLWSHSAGSAGPADGPAGCGRWPSRSPRPREHFHAWSRHWAVEGTLFPPGASEKPVRQPHRWASHFLTGHELCICPILMSDDRINLLICHYHHGFFFFFEFSQVTANYAGSNSFSSPQYRWPEIILKGGGRGTPGVNGE